MSKLAIGGEVAMPNSLTLSEKRKMGIKEIMLTVVPLLILVIYSGYWLYFCANPCFEGDDINILAGVEQMLRNFYPPLRYRFDNQPLFYVLLKILTCMTGADLLRISLGVSQVCLFVILTLIYLSARKVRSPRFALLMLSAGVGIHEIVISGAYPNSSILALAFLSLALYLLVLDDTHALLAGTAGGVIVLAGLARNDAVFMLPTLLLIPVFQKQNRKIPVILLSMSLVGLALIYLLNLDISEPLSKVRAHFGQAPNLVAMKGGSKISQLGNTILVLFSALPLAIIFLSLLGAVVLVLKKKWRDLILVGSAIFPLSLFYITKLGSPKYLLYIFPVVAWLAVEGWSWLDQNKNRIVQISFLALWLAQGLVGITVHFPKKPWRENFNFQPHYKWFTLHPPFFSGSIDIGVGNGQIWVTQDGARPLTGIFFFPLGMHVYAGKQKATKEKLLSLCTPYCDYFVNYEQRGFLNYSLTHRAIGYFSETPKDSSPAHFIMPDKGEISVREFSYSQSKAEAQLAQLKALNAQGRTLILCIEDRYDYISFLRLNFNHMTVQPLAPHYTLITIPAKSQN